MRSKRAVVFVVGAVMIAGTASAQKKRIHTYQKTLEANMETKLEEFRASLVEAEELEAAEEATSSVVRRRGPRGDTAPVVTGADVTRDDAVKPFECVVIVGDSADEEGQDVEIRLTMPIDAFMEFAPIAALEAAAVPHKFPAGFIYLREETTDRVARVAFVDAERIAGRYLAGDAGAVEDMADALIWH